MVRFCAIGDPHGDLKKVRMAPKDVDFYLITGDLGDASYFRKLFMRSLDEGVSIKKCEKRGGLKDRKKAYLRLHKSTLDVLEYLARFAPTYSIQGNVGIITTSQAKKDTNKEGFRVGSTRKIIDESKDMHIIKNVVRRLGGLRVGFLEYFVDEGWVRRFGDKERMGKAKRMTGKAKRILERFGKVHILVCHQPPYGYLDRVSKEYGAPKKWWGKHAGSKVILDYIKKFQPRYVFCGHIHEGEGFAKVGESGVWNLGVGGFRVVEMDGKS